ncbi:MAG: hypothetical protein ACYC5G_02820 [Candidatus Doudnabacteria bacterium]
MRVYAPNLIKSLALFDLPTTKYSHTQNTYLEKIFRQLLVYDGLPDSDFESVLEEVKQTSAIQNPAFEIFFNRDFEKYIKENKHHARWHKIIRDYNYYVDWEIRRRNKENPYSPTKTLTIETIENLPDFSKQRKNHPYQFDQLYLQAKQLAEHIDELTKDYKEKNDKDMFRVKVNSILLPQKIVFALNSSEAMREFVEGEIVMVNIKIALDALKLADRFLESTINSLTKMTWYAAGQDLQKIEKCLHLAQILSPELHKRINDSEKLFIFFMESEIDA